MVVVLGSRRECRLVRRDPDRNAGDIRQLHRVEVHRRVTASVRGIPALLARKGNLYKV
jgi:hypothetical protein